MKPSEELLVKMCSFCFCLPGKVLWSFPFFELLGSSHPSCSGLYRPDQGASTKNASDCGGDKGERKGIGQKVCTDSGGCGSATHDGGWGQGRRTGSGEAEVADVGIVGMPRSKTVGKVMEILSSGQAVKFLVAAAQLKLRIRALGTQPQLH